ncbi:MAG: hypothetical protein Q7R89_00680 [bacterium]|nr:hypothetical protein [bacterium]
MKKQIKQKKSTKPESNNWDFFDDCGICQAMKHAEKHKQRLSLEELKNAFEKQNSKNHGLKELMNKVPK